ncbi:translocation/assembly module TamB domain-containing protein [Halomicronema sp. CCY15110]|uniref:translocation/assembly module TamB domain-containing protein n=1 Tax=Halomicronema sp. CCY15110 TaxID=2767773 RepID=UPI00194E8603|nr:translocation/assembly module TamB domain-containing protein [Halomicronema sp. CCY15110]
MSNRPNPLPPDSAPEESSSRRSFSPFLKIAAGIGVVAAAGGIVAVVYGDRLIESQVIPLVEDEVEQTIGRPVEIGDVQGLSFWGIRIGESTLPPTATDATTATVDEVQVSINLSALLFHREIQPDIVLVRPDVNLVQAEDGQWIELDLPEAVEDPPFQLELQQVEVRDARVTVSTKIQDPEAVVARVPVVADTVNVEATFAGDTSQQVVFELAGNVDTGSFDIQGEADLEQLAVQTNVRLQAVPIAAANLVLPSPLGLTGGVLNTNLTAAAALTADYQLDLDAIDVQGTARLQDGEVQVLGLPSPIRNINSRLRFQGQQVTLEETGLQLNDIRLMAEGDVHLQEGHNLQAQIPAIAIADVQTLAELALPIAADGTFQLNAEVTGELLDPQITGRLSNQGAVQVDQVEVATLTSDFRLNRERFDLTELRIVPEAGGIVLAQGRADLTDLTKPQFQLTAQVDVPVDPFVGLYGISLPPDIVVGNLTADAEAAGTLASQTAVAQWQLSDSTFPGRGTLTLAENQLVLDNTRLQVAEGSVTAQAIADLTTGNWQATATTAQVPVEQFTPQAQGLLTANLEASGNLYNFDLATIQAAGDAVIADALVQPVPTAAPLLPQGDWRTEFEFLGDRIAVNRFTAPNVQADGTIGLDFNQALPIGALALNVALQDYDLQPLNSFVPAVAREYGQLTGFTSFTGQLTGTLDDPQVTGNAQLVDLAVNDFIFAPLTGPVALSLAQGGELDLRSQEGDRVSLVVDADLWPAAFEIRNQDFVAFGTGANRRINATVENLPLEKFAVQPARDYGFGIVSGLVDLQVTANLTDFQNPIADGTLTVNDPGLDPVAADLFTAAFRYADNTAVLSQGELLFDSSRILLAGSAILQPDLSYTGQLTVAEGYVEDLVAIAETIDLEALRFGLQRQTPIGSAADLQVQSIRLPMASFLEQLEAFIAYEATRPDQSTPDNPLALPDLDTLAGEFSGGLTVAGRSLDLDGLTADFNFQGQSWVWGPYNPTNQFVVSGNVQQSTVTLDPVSAIIEDTVVNLMGSGSLERLQGQLLVDNLPVELAQAFYPLPLAVTGDIDVTTEFDGSLANPQIAGELLVADPQVGEQPLERVAATFGYRNAVFEVDGVAAIAPDEQPLTLQGTVPYALPFMTVQPTSDTIALVAIVPDDAFDLVNVLTAEEVRWEGGDGEIRVQVGGTVFAPIVAGAVTLREGIIGSKELGQPLTNLTGQVNFDLQQVSIPQLQGQMGDGTLAISGQLPLLPSGESLLAQASPKQQPKPSSTEGTRPSNGISIALGGLPLDYRGVVDLRVNGRMGITGAVLEPTIGGKLELDEGFVQANQLLRQVGAIDFPTVEEVQQINPYRAQFLGIDPLAPTAGGAAPGFLERVSLQNLVVVFRDRLIIAGQPFYNLTADGGIRISGTVSDPQPDGKIDLRTGWINLFSTQFLLDPNAPNSVVFTPEDGLDPYVDVVLRTRVRETNVTEIPPSNDGFVSSEISDNDIRSVGEVQFINVEAIAQGYASDLSETLSLTSNPARSQEQLVALLGSNITGGLANATLTQFAGFLGAGGLAGFGNNLANALGLRSFSVFPTTDTSEESTAGVAIGVEASFAIGDSIGINVLEILNSGNPPQIGLQYRITDELQLRGSSNLNDTEMRLEYRTTF